MTQPISLDRMITRDRLIHFLGVHGEADEFDFKETVDLKTKPARAELARDVLAFMNTEGGGSLIFGVVDSTYDLVGLAEDVQLDTTKVHNALTVYIDGSIPCAAAVYAVDAEEVGKENWEKPRRFGILYVAQRPGAARPRCEASFPDAHGSQKQVLRVTDVPVRRGGQTTIADAADMHRLMGGSTPEGGSVIDENHEEGSSMLIASLPSPEEIAIHFVGRRDELEKLEEWLLDSRARQRLLAGDGGKGKSAIAYQLATRLKALRPHSLDGVLWISAKRRRFVEGKVQAIQRPDFWDLESLLDAIARGYGFNEYAALPLEEKRRKVIELLTDLPVLLVADDIDSLEGVGDDAYLFLVAEAAQTRSKVLLTSRDVKFGMNNYAIQVSGFNDPDGIEFIRLRVQLFHLDEAIFTQKFMRDILRVTDRSPLYIEELLRLCAVLPVHEALKRWEEHGGDAAREYALKQEFDKLPDAAKRIVITVCLFDGPVSFLELQAVTGLTQDQMLQGIDSLQKLFLVGRPRLIDGVERYDINTNTRRLILKTQQRERPEWTRQLTEAYRQVTGKFDARVGREVGSIIRQAMTLQSLRRYEDAEDTIRAGLENYPNNASLIAELGIISTRRQPPNRTDAREHFIRAAQLKCSREQMYLLWAHQELGLKEWKAALAALEYGRANVGDTPHLLYDEGYAHSRWGQQFLREFQTSRGTDELIKALHCYRLALKGLSDPIGEEDRELAGRVFRGLIIAGEHLYRLDPSNDLANDILRWANRWVNTCPQDALAREEQVRLRLKYSGTTSG